ncbi:hypothetical protein TEA_014629 [Camellia sinensis var. sinensis]|uniref:Uncharacterized protein n=1 Tax=Camellia sinensis var. sinensis TaxID=542762 RepID=A0A4S4DWJ8_CAMSN|nr:hypothetical protein TEA_014629 [Camellia sinensis var. sinensis]
MDFHTATGSPSSSTSSSDPNLTNSHHHNGGHNHHDTDPMHSWWESISKARSRIHLLSSLLPPSSSSTAASLDSLADSDRPARSLLSSFSAYSALSSSLSSPLSGSGDDPLCQWLYETYQSSDTDLRLVVLSFIPLLSGIYLSRIHSSSASMPSLAGFEAVLLSLYAAETKSRAGKPVLPVLRILGHCLLAPLNAEEVKDAASMAVRCLYARASHDLAPQAILATRSLIQLDKRARESARATAMATAVSNANTPSKAKKPEILLVSK